MRLACSDGSVANRQVGAADDQRLLRRLRELMAAQGRGAWLSATVGVSWTGRCSFDYNYDVRPDWTVPTRRRDLQIEDLNTCPRARARCWLGLRGPLGVDASVLCC